MISVTVIKRFSIKQKKHTKMLFEKKSISLLTVFILSLFINMTTCGTKINNGNSISFISLPYFDWCCMHIEIMVGKETKEMKNFALLKLLTNRQKQANKMQQRISPNYILYTTLYDSIFEF